MLEEYTVTQPDVISLMLRHDKATEPGFVHTNLEPTQCACNGRGQVVATQPQSSGNACFVCGGITVQTGTCTTCTSCGTSGGCG